MTDKPTSAKLRYCIIADTTEDILQIKNAFETLPHSPVLSGGFQNAEEFLWNAINGHNPDFIVIGISAMQQLEAKDALNIPIILVHTERIDLTSNKQSFIGQVEKPLQTSRLEDVMDRLDKLKPYSRQENVEIIPQKKTSKTFLTRKGKEYILLTTDNIPAFYTDNKITFAFDTSGKKFMINMTLIELENSLDGSMFFRANRQYLINRNFISRVRQLEEGRYEIVITATEPIRVEINQQKFSRLRQWIEV